MTPSDFDINGRVGYKKRCNYVAFKFLFVFFGVE